MSNILIWMLNQLCGWHICYDDKGAVCIVRPDVPYTSTRTVPIEGDKP